MTNTISNFMILDDDPINNLICNKILKNVYPETHVLTFSDPVVAISYITLNFESTTAPDVVLFLDINMPVLTGWDVLDAFERFNISVKSHFRIYMLTSSFEAQDKQRAAENINVSGYFEKPLTRDKVKSIAIVMHDDIHIV